MRQSCTARSNTSRVPSACSSLDRGPARVVILLPNDDTRTAHRRNARCDATLTAAHAFTSDRRVALLLLTACGELKTPTDPGGGGESRSIPTATFTRVQNEIFTPTCARSAATTRSASSRRWCSPPAAPTRTSSNVPSVEMPQLLRVAPSDPANSYLYRKITGAGITGDRMPLRPAAALRRADCAGARLDPQRSAE